jgi:lysine 6-dehydrogenase
MQDHYTYLVLGSGRQGCAAGYDMARWGSAGRVLLADQNLAVAQSAAARVNAQLGTELAFPLQVDASDPASLASALQGVDACLSAVPYYLNLEITRLAVECGVSLCDLGGNIDIARQQHQYHESAVAAGISIIPNCGQVPGMGTTLAVYAIEMLDQAVDVFMWDGGNPQKPRPPFN